MGSVSMLRMSHSSIGGNEDKHRFSSKTALGASPALYHMNQVWSSH
jgi:hypothetical protein